MNGIGVQGFEGSRVQRFKGSGFKGSEVQRFRGSRVQRFKGSAVLSSGFKGSLNLEPLWAFILQPGTVNINRVVVRPW